MSFLLSFFPLRTSQIAGVLLTLCLTPAFAQQTITFTAEDGLTITGDLYENSEPTARLILLCHQAESSRGEYREIAPKLVEMGFTCLAIDQRSGKSFNGVENETHAIAVKNDFPIEFIYTEQDIVAAIQYLNDRYKKPVTVIGSSYSASQVLMIAATNRKIERVAVFSPGEYFKGLSVSTYVQYIKKPVFATGAAEELSEVRDMMAGMDQRFVTYYETKGVGAHGALALQTTCDDQEGYWQALTSWLLIP